MKFCTSFNYLLFYQLHCTFLLLQHSFQRKHNAKIYFRFFSSCPPTGYFYSFPDFPAALQLTSHVIRLFEKKNLSKTATTLNSHSITWNLVHWAIPLHPLLSPLFIYLNIFSPEEYLWYTYVKLSSARQQVWMPVRQEE